MKVLIIGNGGRENALAWKVKNSPLLTNLFISPGNAGTDQLGKNIDIDVSQKTEILKFVKSNKIDLTLVGPEAPLEDGIVDLFVSEKQLIFGPSKKAAQIETSKVWAKNLMTKYDIPTAKFFSFNDFTSAEKFILSQKKLSWVIKADGLAAGKGVILTNNKEESINALKQILIDRKFGNAGNKIIIEEMLFGKEVSIFSFVNGKFVSSHISACDYKRSHDGDKGLNTGGMGAYSPPEFWNENLSATIHEEIMIPTANALVEENAPFNGMLYGGIMLTSDGPKVLEFNCRFGDPETQVILPKLSSDILEICYNTAKNTLNEKTPIKWNNDNCVGVVITSGGYPESYKTGHEIKLSSNPVNNSLIFHSGTKIENDGKITTNGGRVLVSVGIGETMTIAKNKAYQNIDNIYFKNMYFRKDISERALS